MADSLDFKNLSGKWVMTYSVLGLPLYTVNGRRWCNMRSRSNPKGAYQKGKPTYLGVRCEFKDFQSFAEWSSVQVGSKMVGWQLDKDLLGSGKTYSPEFCVYLPPEVNSFITNPAARRGAYPLGVSWKAKNSRYVANCREPGGVYKHLGLFDSEGDAFSAYKVFKESAAQTLATKWRDQIDPRAYDALMSYEVLITD